MKLSLENETESGRIFVQLVYGDFLRLEGGGLTSVKIAIFIRVIIIRQTPIREVMLEMVA